MFEFISSLSRWLLSVAGLMVIMVLVLLRSLDHSLQQISTEYENSFQYNKSRQSSVNIHSLLRQVIDNHLKLSEFSYQRRASQFVLKLNDFELNDVRLHHLPVAANTEIQGKQLSLEVYLPKHYLIPWLNHTTAFVQVNNGTENFQSTQSSQSETSEPITIKLELDAFNVNVSNLSKSLSTHSSAADISTVTEQLLGLLQSFNSPYRQLRVDAQLNNLTLALSESAESAESKIHLDSGRFIYQQGELSLVVSTEINAKKQDWKQDWQVDLTIHGDAINAHQQLQFDANLEGLIDASPAVTIDADQHDDASHQIRLSSRGTIQPSDQRILADVELTVDTAEAKPFNLTAHVASTLSTITDTTANKTSDKTSDKGNLLQLQLIEPVFNQQSLADMYVNVNLSERRWQLAKPYEVDLVTLLPLWDWLNAGQSDDQAPSLLSSLSVQSGQLIVNQFQWRETSFPKFEASLLNLDLGVDTLQAQLNQVNFDVVTRKNNRSAYGLDWRFYGDESQWHMPKQYPQALIFNPQLSGQLRLTTAGLSIQNNAFQPISDLIKTKLQGFFPWSHNSSSQPQLSVDLLTTATTINDIKPFIPNNLHPDNQPNPALAWIDEHLDGGRIDKLELQFRPFAAESEQHFVLLADIADSKFRIGQQWPKFVARNTNLRFNGGSQWQLSVHAQQLEDALHQTQVEQITLRMYNPAPPPSEEKPIAQLEAGFTIPKHTDITTALRSYLSLPLPHDNTMYPELTKIAYSNDSQGFAEGHFWLSMPLISTSQAALRGIQRTIEVDVDVQFKQLDFNLDFNSDFNFQGFRIRQANGSLSIDKNGILPTINKAQLVDHQDHVILPAWNLHSQPLNSNGIHWSGTMSVQGEFFSPLLSGGTQVQWHLLKQPEQTQLRLQSDLVGINSFIPGIFSKANQSKMPLVVLFQDNPQQSTLNVTLANPLLKFEQRVYKDNTPGYTVIAVGTDTQKIINSETEGVNAHLVIPQINTKLIRSLTEQPLSSSLTRFIRAHSSNQVANSSDLKAPNSQEPHSQAISTFNDSTLRYSSILNALHARQVNEVHLASNEIAVDPILLEQANLTLQAFSTTTSIADTATVQASPQESLPALPNAYRLSVQSSQTQGVIQFMEDSLDARFSRLAFKPRFKPRNDHHQCQPIAPFEWVNTRLNANQVWIGDTPFGKLSMQLSATTKANNNALSIPFFSLKHPSRNIDLRNVRYVFPTLASSSHTQHQTTTPSSQANDIDQLGQTSAQVNLQFDDLKNLTQLTGLSLPGYFAEDIQINGDIRFAGPANCINSRSLNGKLRIETGSGTIQGIEPGIGRVLGILNATNLYRIVRSSEQERLNRNELERLGMYFDSFKADVLFKDGEIEFRRARIDSPIAIIRLSGSISTKNERYDLKAQATPTISTAYITLTTLFSGPVAGLTAYLSNLLLKPIFDLNDVLFSYEVDIKGSYSDPTITERVQAPEND